VATTGAYVAYFRVSTARQGRSGLGLEAQENAVLTYLNGGKWELKAAFTEIESGADDDRPELQKALAACRRFNATLIVAKLDRLSRDVHFVTGLAKKGVRFVVAEWPEVPASMSPFMVGVIGSINEKERLDISERTKAALAAAKRRGVKLGGHPERISRADARKGAARSAAVRSGKADEFAAAFAPRIHELRASGVTSLRAIAAALNAAGERTPRGGQWSAGQVAKLLKRIDARG
jgi:DNA invertase Pin-like site-specific DNA recombinase